jgi:hypothetical protein
VVLTVAADGGTVTITDIYNGDTKLTKNTDYSISDNEITIAKEYLDDLAEDDYTIIIETNQGDLTATITVIDTTEEG